jgi:hypothetical protein
MFNIPGLFAATAVQPALVGLILVAGAWAMIAPNGCELIRQKKMEPTPAWAIGLGILGSICVLLCSESGPFLYFQF